MSILHSDTGKVELQQHIIGIIPARYASTRLPGKLLLDICGKPLLQRVWEAACRSDLLRRIVIATDDERIAELCFNIGAEWVMTPSEIQSGTDRVLYAYRYLECDADIIVNIQGDEPLLDGKIIDEMLISFVNTECEIGTIVRKIDNYTELFDPSAVKVVLRNNNTAMYFSRSVIPYLRDVPREKWLSNHIFYKHIGIYAYLSGFLSKINTLDHSSLEFGEKLEQLRFLQSGASVHCTETEAELIGVDTPADLEKIRFYFKDEIQMQPSFSF